MFCNKNVNATRLHIKPRQKKQQHVVLHPSKWSRLSYMTFRRMEKITNINTFPNDTEWNIPLWHWEAPASKGIVFGVFFLFPAVPVADHYTNIHICSKQSYLYFDVVPIIDPWDLDARCSGGGPHGMVKYHVLFNWCNVFSFVFLFLRFVLSFRFFLPLLFRIEISKWSVKSLIGNQLAQNNNGNNYITSSSIDNGIVIIADNKCVDFV